MLEPLPKPVRLAQLPVVGAGPGLSLVTSGSLVTSVSAEEVGRPVSVPSGVVVSLVGVPVGVAVVGHELVSLGLEVFGAVVFGPVVNGAVVPVDPVGPGGIDVGCCEDVGPVGEPVVTVVSVVAGGVYGCGVFPSSPQATLVKFATSANPIHVDRFERTLFKTSGVRVKVIDDCSPQNGMACQGERAHRSDPTGRKVASVSALDQD